MDKSHRSRQIGPDALGRRVTVRHLLSDQTATDVVGRVRDIGPPLAIEQRDGAIQRVDPARVVAWRVVPDRPRRTRSAVTISDDDLQRIMSRGWPASESQALGDWELRASAGFTRRANSAAILGEPGVDLADALAITIEFYRSRELPPLAQVVAGSSGDLQLREHGWTPHSPTAVLVREVDAAPPLHPSVVVTRRANQDWAAAYSADLRIAAVDEVLHAPPTVGFLNLDGAIARIAVTGEWAGISCLAVPADARRQGRATVLVESALAWAHAAGADKAYAQVEQDNVGSISLLRQLGFDQHHLYQYLGYR